MSPPIVIATYAKNYGRLYATDEEELRACLGENRAARGAGVGTFDPSNPQLYWWPSSVDFQEEAARSGHPVGVANFNELLAAIKRYRDLRDVYWYGHGSPSGEYQFGGGVRFKITDVAALRNSDVSKHFVSGGAITFFACNAGQKSDFLQAIANALRVPVRGFRTGVKWNLEYRGVAPHRRISKRIMQRPSTQAIIELLPQ
jgi:hypothetical protein